ncbi:MAG: hypothetical protein Q7K29_06910 [Thermoleophilia bacterium]|nr:hypothetical protein [Thermoleophilia bacterium]
MRYVDFDSEELSEYPDVYHRVTVDRDLEPGAIIFDGRLVPMWDIQYNRLAEEFVKLGAERLRKAS